MRSQRKKVTNTAWYSCETINNVLIMLCMSGVTSDDKGNIVRVQSKLSFYVMMTVTVSVVILSLSFTFSGNEWLDSSIISWASYFVRLLSTVNVIFVIISHFRFDIKIYQHFFSNYVTMDRFLGIDNNDCSLEKQRLNRVFFSRVILVGIKECLELVFILVTQGKFVVFKVVDNIYICYVNYISVVNLLAKLTILKGRCELFAQRIILDLRIHEQQKTLSTQTMENIKQYRRFYSTVLKQNRTLYNTFGWQIFIIGSYLTLFVILTIHGIIVSIITAETWLWLGPIFIKISINLECWFCVIRTIESIRKSRAKIILHLESVLVEQRLDTNGYSQIKALLDLCYRQPIEFSVCNILNLNYKFTQTWVNVVITYTIVLAQLLSLP